MGRNRNNRTNETNHNESTPVLVTNANANVSNDANATPPVAPQAQATSTPPNANANVSNHVRSLLAALEASNDAKKCKGIRASLRRAGWYGASRSRVRDIVRGEARSTITLD